MTAAPDRAPPPGPALHEAKRLLRERVLRLRDDVDAAARARASRAIVERIAALPAFRSARTLLLTVPFRSEWDTRPLIAAALARGVVVALPRVDASKRMLDLRRVEPGDPLAPGAFGIPEPASTSDTVDPGDVDWILVPGVAFDPAGGRLGYGGGYYDRLQPLLRASSPRVAGAFELQIVDRVPAAPHDRGVDLIVTERRLYEAHPDR